MKVGSIHGVEYTQLLLTDELVQAALLGIKHATWRPILRRNITRCKNLKGVGYVNPWGERDDILYVREAWNLISKDESGNKVWRKPIPKEDPGNGWYVVYRADHGGDFAGPWRPSIHMPKWMSRILYSIESVEVRKIQSITSEEIKLDGIRIPAANRENKEVPLLRITGRFVPSDYVKKPLDKWDSDDVLRSHFASSWDSLYYDKGYGWDANPACWHIQMKKVV